MVAGRRKTLFRRDAHGETMETFELTADPRERTPAAAEDQAAVRRLRSQQSLWAKARLPFTAESNFLSPRSRSEFIRRHRDRRANVALLAEGSEQLEDIVSDRHGHGQALAVSRHTAEVCGSVWQSP
jgi:hypothetical protein